MSSNPNGVVVWEWQDEFSKWYPYKPGVSVYIEQNCNSPVVHLGNGDPALFVYFIDMARMEQCNQGTGTRKRVRRSIYPPTSPAGKGITWQWLGDANKWCDYNMETAGVLEDAFSKQAGTIDLYKASCKIPYTVDFNRMLQIRNQTGTSRNVRRITTNVSYTPVSVGSALTHGGGLPQNTTSAPLTFNQIPAHSHVFPSSSSYALFGVTPSNSNSSLNSAASSAFGLPPQFGAPHLSNGAVSSNHSSFLNTNPVASNSAAGLRKKSSSTHYMGMHSPLKMTRLQASKLHVASSSSQQPMVPSSQLNLPGGASGTTHSSGFAAASRANPNSASNPFSSRITPAMSVPQAAMLAAGGHQGAAPSTSHHTSRSGSVTNNAGDSSSTQNAEDVLAKYITPVTDNPGDEDCCICCDKLSEESGYGGSESGVIWKLKCNHMYHKACLCAMYDSGTKDGHVQCPSCKAIYGEKMGNCPSGHMDWHTIPQSLPGHEGAGTICITYHIKAGIMGPEHPQPGQPFSCIGFPRRGFLPDTENGRRIHNLLIKAWQRRLTFTIGTSVTNGESNTVVWNEIHHKTESRSNHSGHGYPDPNYEDNVIAELAAQGVTDES